MSLRLTQEMGIANPSLEILITEKIGDGKKDVFINPDNYFKEIIANNIFDISNALELGECEVDGIKAMRKLGVVYISDNKLDFFDKNNRIYSIVPALKYSTIDTETTTLEYITVYNQYNLIFNEYSLIIVSYTEAL